jgi:hypothetical protein
MTDTISVISGEAEETHKMRSKMTKLALHNEDEIEFFEQPKRVP